MHTVCARNVQSVRRSKMNKSYPLPIKSDNDRDRIIRRLILLKHVRQCTRGGPVMLQPDVVNDLRLCRLPECPKLKELLQHFDECTQGKVK